MAEKKFYHIIGIFDSEEALVGALDKLKQENVKVEEIFTPYPVHKVLKFMGKESRMTYAAWLYGVTAAAAILSFLYYTSVISWPLNYGGKPFNSFPSFLVITIVLTIFTVTITSLFTFSVRAKIYPGKEPVIYDERATDDKFVIVFDANQAGKDNLEPLLKENGASEVYEKEINV